MNFFFELVVASFCLSCSRHQEYITAEALYVQATGSAFYYQKPRAYNKQFTNRACLSRTTEYWLKVVAVLLRPRANIPQYGPLARLVSG